MADAKVMVSLRDADSVEDLVRLACQVSEGMKARVIALHVVEMPIATPIDADEDVLDHPGKELLEHAKRFASEHCSTQISTRLLRARQAGEAIVGELKEQGYDLLVMGYHRPHTVGEILLGSTVQYVARHAPCRVLVDIPPPRRR